MSDHREVAPQFDARARERLAKLFRSLGSDNVHEADAVRGAIDNFLLRFAKGWGDLIELLVGRTLLIQPEIASAIVGLGNPDPEQRAAARRCLTELLARHRKTWNDLADTLLAGAPGGWLNIVLKAPKRVNALALTVHLIEQYAEFASPHDAVAVALWALHTHVFRFFACTPRLALRSPAANCGKTTLLDVLSRLVANPARHDSITAAALYREIDQRHPTMLLDEADNLMLGLQANGRIRAIFNSGHRVGGMVTIADRGEVRSFSTFCPLVLALPEATAGLPRTLNSRCLTIGMRRAQRKLLRFDPVRPDPALEACYQQILSWRNDAALDPDPAIPLRNRLADNWRPLVSVADDLGWGEKARAAALHFAAGFKDADPRIMALADIRRVFGELDRMTSATLLAALLGLTDSDCDWSAFRGIGGDLAPHKLRDTELADLLREFEIKPHTIWPVGRRTAATKSARGYRREQFEEAWAAYCSDD